jgi:hypothetical protein
MKPLKRLSFQHAPMDAKNSVAADFETPKRNQKSVIASEARQSRGKTVKSGLLRSRSQ